MSGPEPAALDDPARVGQAPAGATTRDPGLRERIVARFREWLDEALVGEGPPQGLAADLLRGEPADAERACDLYSLWAATTTLAQEVKVQGRTFHALEQAISGLPGEVAALAAASAPSLAERRRAEEERALAPLLDLLLDLRESLRRGRDAAAAHTASVAASPQPGVLARLLGRASPPRSGEAERAFVRGYELALERLDEALRARGVEPIECLGQAFDPQRMRAVELAEPAGRRPGVVVEVYRGGWLRGGEVLRPAEVKVTRASEGGR